MLCLIGRFIFLLITHSCSRPGRVGSTYFLHLAFDNLLFIVFAWWWELYYVFLFVYIAYFCFVCFNSIWFAFCYVFFKLCYFFFCSAKSTFIHLLELHVWFGFLLLIIIIYHKYVRQYVTGIESQDKLWTEEEIRNDMSSGLPTVFFYLFFKKCRLSKFCFFFLKYNNNVQFMSREIQTFNQTFSRASVNNEINWKLEGTNRKLTRKAYELLFFSSRISFFKFFLFLYFFNNLASNIISFLLKKTLFFFACQVESPSWSRPTIVHVVRLTRSMW